ncbi:hypothetical protein QTP86_021896, partial [Hemibagrus guttatus]
DVCFRRAYFPEALAYPELQNGKSPMDILAILEIRFGTVQTSDLPEDVNAACGADLPVSNTSPPPLVAAAVATRGCTCPSTGLPLRGVNDAHVSWIQECCGFAASRLRASPTRMLNPRVC